MTKHLNTLALIAVMIIPSSATAQEALTSDGATATQSEQPDASAPFGAGATDDVGLQLGRIYEAGEFGDWIIECVRTATPANDPCDMTQVLRDENDNDVVKIFVTALNATEEDEAQAGMRIIAPLMTFLPAGLTLRIDNREPSTLGFIACDQTGCHTEVGLLAADMDMLRRGLNGSVRIRPVAAPDQFVEAGLSLRGFTAAYGALTAN